MKETKRILIIIVIVIGLGIVVKTMINPTSFNDTGIAEGSIAPPIDFKDMTGRSYTLASLAGKVVLLNFWSITCPPCLYEIPELNKLQQTYRDRELVILSINTDDIDEARIQKTIEEHRFEVAVVLDRRYELSHSEAFGISALPTAYLIDQNSVIAKRFVGMIPWNSKEVYDLLDHLLAGQK